MTYNNEIPGTGNVLVPVVPSDEIRFIDFKSAYTALNDALLVALQLPDKDWNNQRRVRILLTPVVVPQVEIFVENSD